jgi:hypothetical protein
MMREESLACVEFPPFGSPKNQALHDSVAQQKSQGHSRSQLNSAAFKNPQPVLKVGTVVPATSHNHKADGVTDFLPDLRT